MVSILTPLGIVITLYLILSFFIYLSKKIFLLLRSKTSDLFQYKLKNYSVSIIFVATYVKFFIFFFYFLRIYSVEKILDLKIIIQKVIFFYCMALQLPYLFVIILYTIILITAIIIYFIACFLWLHHYIYKEIHKVFIYIAYKDYSYQNIHIKKLFNFISDIFLRDMIKYVLDELIYYITIKTSSKDFDYMKLPWYHLAKLKNKLTNNKLYDFIVRISPVFFILYDCFFNNFVLTHVYYYLLFYIPLRLLQRVTTTCGFHSYYIGNLIWEIYYKDEDCIYAISPKYKPFLDSYLISGLKTNFDLGTNAELFLYNYVRFTLSDEEKGIFRNIEDIELQEINGKYFEIREDEDGNTIIWEEWPLLADKTKHKLPTSEILYKKEKSNEKIIATI